MGHIIIVPFLVALSAVFSGMTLGSFTLSKYELKRKMELGDKRAEKIYKVRENGNLLLCTLLLGNVTVNSVLSIFLGSITSGVVASVLSISLIVVLGEILPQAIFARHALVLGSKFVWLVNFFLFIMYPVAKPLSMILDKILGEELPAFYSKKELEKIIMEQEHSSGGVFIDADEKRIIKGVLSYSEKTAGEIMTPRTVMTSISFDQKLDQNKIGSIKNSGHSRIPVYKENSDNIVGILYVKDLVGDNLVGKKVGDVARRKVIFINPDKRLDDLLNDFKRTKNHLFVVVDEFGAVEGLVTIEDVIEEIIGEEIVDEFDKFENLQRKAMEVNENRLMV